MSCVSLKKNIRSYIIIRFKNICQWGYNVCICHVLRHNKTSLWTGKVMLRSGEKISLQRLHLETRMSSSALVGLQSVMLCRGSSHVTIFSFRDKQYFLSLKVFGLFLHFLIWSRIMFWAWTPLVVLLSGIVVAHYLQSITPALALGGELVYHRRPGEEGTVMSLVGRYTGETQVIVSMSSGSTSPGFMRQ